MSGHDHDFLSTKGSGEPSRGPLDGLREVFKAASAELEAPGLPASGDWPCQRSPATPAPPRLLAALYLLLRDHVKPGDLEQVMLNVVAHHDEHSVFTNHWLEHLARSYVTYLLEIPAPVHTGQPIEGDECDDDDCPLCGVV